MSVSPNLSGFLIYANLHLLDNVSLFYTGKTYNRDFSLVSTRNIFFFPPAGGDQYKIHCFVR